MNLGSISKAIAAGTGGIVAGTVGLPLLPDGTPWYGYIILYAVTALIPALLTYIAPPNKG